MNFGMIKQKLVLIKINEKKIIIKNYNVYDFVQYVFYKKWRKIKIGFYKMVARRENNQMQYWLLKPTLVVH